MIRIFLVSLIALSCLSSCGGGSNEVAVQFSGGDSTFLLPGETQSCYTQAAQAAGAGALPNDVTERYFQIRNFKITWSALDATFEVFSLIVKIPKELTGKVETFQLGGNELHSLDKTVGGWSGVIPKAPSTMGADGKLQPTVDANGAQNLATFPATCPPTFGGVKIPDNLDKGQKYVSAELTVVGIKRYDDGREEPASVKSFLTIVNYGLH